MTFKIVGYRINYEYRYGGDTRQMSIFKQIIATFDDKKDALKYIEDSRLKNPTIHDRPFRQNSLLASFQYVEVEQPDDPPPHNPIMGKRRK